MVELYESHKKKMNGKRLGDIDIEMVMEWGQKTMLLPHLPLVKVLRGKGLHGPTGKGMDRGQRWLALPVLVQVNQVEVSWKLREVVISSFSVSSLWL